MEPRADYLSDLPVELLKFEILQHLHFSSLIFLPQASKYFYGFFPEQYHQKRNLALDHLRRLLSHAALGEWKEAEKIWSLFPDLLTIRGTIYNPDRTVDIPFYRNPCHYKFVNHTAWQIAIMNEEYEEAERMGEHITQEEKRKQFAEIFPDGKIQKYNFDLNDAKKLLLDVFDAAAQDEYLKIEYDKHSNIKNIVMSESTQSALYKLYAYAKPKSRHEIGLVFDTEFYYEALKLYNKKEGDQFKQKGYQYTFWHFCVTKWLAECSGTFFLLHSTFSHHMFTNYTIFENYVAVKQQQVQALCSDIRQPKRRRIDKITL